MRVVVFAQTTRIQINHLFEIWQVRLNFQNLINLFLIARDDITCATVTQNIGHLFGNRILVQRNGNAACHFDTHHRNIEAGAITADDRNKIPLFDPQVDQAKRERLCLGRGICPRPSLPNSKFFFTIRGRRWIVFGIPTKQRRNGSQPVLAIQWLSH